MKISKYLPVLALVALIGQAHAFSFGPSDDAVVIAPPALDLPDTGRLLVTQGQLQVELAVEHANVRQPLGDFLSGRFKDIASLLRRSQVPLMMFSTAQDTHSQLRIELGKLGGTRP